ncbi:MAG: EamA/RhaT family transporter [Nitrospirae bacterium]|nr:MAG: EamA/RhaT family transporter [Nitrospirota bacterium]
MWILLTLASAFSLATSDALTKRVLNRENELMVAWLRLLFSLPLLILIFPFIDLPETDWQFWSAFLSALPLEILALILYVKALRLSPMSLTLPFLSLTPLFLIITSRLLIGERVSMQGAAGILLIVTGSYTLNISSIKNGLLEPVRAIFRERGSVYMILVSFIYSITSTLGKIGVQHSSPVFFGTTYFMAVTLALTPFVYLKLKGGITERLKRDWKLVILPGLFFGLMILTHMFAIEVAKVSYMISLKRTSLLIGSLYGFLFFGEKRVLERLLGAVLMFSGLVLIVNAG